MAEDTTLDTLQTKQRQASLRKTIKDLRQAMGLQRRLERLRAIPETEWAKAEQADSFKGDM